MSGPINSTVVPSWSTWGNATCILPGSPNALWPYCPSEGAAILFATLFAISSGINIYMAARYKLTFCWVLIMGNLWEMFGFSVRTAATQFQQSLGLYTIMLIFILLAPLWINAFIYMYFARMVHYFDPTQRVGKLRATSLGVIFICLDIVAFIAQLDGASLLTSTDEDDINMGKDIYMGGVGFQQAFIFVFTAFVIRFHLRVRRTCMPRSTNYYPSIYIVYASLGLITVRIMFRLAEYSQGFTSAIATTETFQYTFDAVPMFFATCLWAYFHPGRVLVDKEGLFPTRAEKKIMKREKKAAKKAAKERKRAEKKGSKPVDDDASLLNSRETSPAPPMHRYANEPYDPEYRMASFQQAREAEDGEVGRPQYSSIEYGVVH